MGVPAVVGEIVTGFILGPAVISFCRLNQAAHRDIVEAKEAFKWLEWSS